MKSGLLHITQFLIPASVVLQTIRFLQARGRQGCEGFVLWSGTTLSTTTFRFGSVHIPAQVASITEQGLLVTVNGEALFRVNKAVHELGEVVAAQVHSHPSEAYHSPTDDDYPLATMLGALSVVIPDFARNAPKDIDYWAWYRLTAYQKWELVGDDTMVEIE